MKTEIEKEDTVYNKMLRVYGTVYRKNDAFVYVETKIGTIECWNSEDCKLSSRSFVKKKLLIFFKWFFNVKY